MHLPDDLQSTLASRWPALANNHRWRSVTVFPFVVATELPPLEQIQSVNMVPFEGDRVHVPVMDNGGILLPGGTRELGESIQKTLAREMDEELGAVVRTSRLLGYWPCHSSDIKPWRPHLSHPHFLRIVYLGDVELVRPPGNPDDGEPIASIQSLPADEAVAWLRSSGRPELADLYDLATVVRGRRIVDPTSYNR